VPRTQKFQKMGYSHTFANSQRRGPERGAVKTGAIIALPGVDPWGRALASSKKEKIKYPRGFRFTKRVDSNKGLTAVEKVWLAEPQESGNTWRNDKRRAGSVPAKQITRATPNNEVREKQGHTRVCSEVPLKRPIDG